MSKKYQLGDRVRVRFGTRSIGRIDDVREPLVLEYGTLPSTYRVQYDDGNVSVWLHAGDLEPVEQQGEGTG